MQLRKLLAIGLLICSTGCGEPKPPPKGADVDPPKLEMETGTPDSSADTKDLKKEEKTK